MQKRLVLVTAALTAALACSRKAPEPAPGAASATIAAIKSKPNAYLGRRVTLSGEIERIHGQRAFTLGQTGWLVEREMLVLTPRDFENIADNPGGDGLDEGDRVTITGEVVTLEVGEVERELGIDLPEELEELEHDPVLIVRDDSPPRLPPVSAIGGGPSVPMGEPIRDLKLLLDAPPVDILGKEVTIDDAKVQGLVGHGAIWVGNSPKESVLVSLPQRTELRVGDVVDIRGRVEAPPTSASAMERYGASDETSRIIAAEPNMIAADAVTRSD